MAKMKIEEREDGTYLVVGRLSTQNITISEHACFYCNKIKITMDGKEITEPCEHRKEWGRVAAETAGQIEFVEGQIGVE